MTTTRLPGTRAAAPPLVRWVRAWAPTYLTILGLVGVPIAVALFSGGPSTIGFWLQALVWVPVMFLIAVLPIGAASLLVLAPVFWIVSRLFPERADGIIERFVRAGWLILGTAGYVFEADLGDATHVLLPTSSDNLGALIVIVFACATTGGLLWASVTLQGVGWGRTTGAKTLLNARRSSVTATCEPAEEFWSDDPAIGWRAWSWNGSALRGVWATWPSSEFEAECFSCPRPPGWGHVCGIYAVKDPTGLNSFVDPDAIGRVELFGDVIEHERGYRASHARIIDLWVTSPALARQLSIVYPDVNIQVGEAPTTVEEWNWQT